jgi:hypothetical protein
MVVNPFVSFVEIQPITDSSIINEDNSLEQTIQELQIEMLSLKKN